MDIFIGHIIKDALNALFATASPRASPSSLKNLPKRIFFDGHFLKIGEKFLQKTISSRESEKEVSIGPSHVSLFVRPIL
jgi:hypothetical protein